MNLTQLYERKLLTSDAVRELVKLYQQECSQYLSAGTALFRGTKAPVVLGKKVGIRKDRKPLGTLTRESNFYSTAFEYFHDVPRIRNICLYSSTSLMMAQGYGKEYLVIVPDGTKYVFHPHVRDTKPVADEGYETFKEKIQISGKEFDKFFQRSGSYQDLKRESRLRDYFDHAMHGVNDIDDYQLGFIKSTLVTEDASALKKADGEVALFKSTEPGDYVYLHDIEMIEAMAAQLNIPLQGNKIQKCQQFMAGLTTI